MRGIYIGLGIAELENMRQEILAELKARRTGDQAVSVGMGGKSFGFSRMTQEELFSELEEVNYALKYADPDTYGRSISRTVGSHSRPQDK